MTKNKQQTMQRLLDAAGNQIVLRGIDHSGITASARAAGVNKELVYRYFGGWYPLLEALFGQTLLHIRSGSTSENRFLTWQTYTRQFYRHLRTDAAFRVLFCYQTDHPETEFGQRLAQLLERSVSDMTMGDRADADVFRLVLAGVTYSALIPQPAALVELTEQGVQQVFDQLSQATQFRAGQGAHIPAAMVQD